MTANKPPALKFVRKRRKVNIFNTLVPDDLGNSDFFCGPNKSKIYPG